MTGEAAAAAQMQKMHLHPSISDKSCIAPIVKEMKFTLIGPSHDFVYESVFIFILLLIDSVLLPYPLKYNVTTLFIFVIFNLCSTERSKNPFCIFPGIYELSLSKMFIVFRLFDILC